MAEIRINATGGVKLYDADDSHYAQIIAGTITSNVNALTLGHASADFNIPVKVLGTTPTLTIGDAGAEDTKIVFDGNAQDWHIGLDDSADDFVIGLGSTLGTTSHIVIDETGAVTKPLQPSFCATMSADGTVSTTSQTAIPFDTERFDQNADFNTGTYTFTAPVTGRYQLNLGSMFKDATSGNIFMQIVTSNQTYEFVNEGGGTFEHVAITALADMASGDTAVAMTQTASDNDYTQYAGTYSYFSGHLVC